MDTWKTLIEQQEGNELKGISATRPGDFEGCGHAFHRGARITKVGLRWAQVACGEALRAKGVILAGETFRGHKDSGKATAEDVEVGACALAVADHVVRGVGH